MNEFHFIRPEWFYAFIPLIIISALLFRIQTKHRGWQAYCDKKLLPYLLAEKSTKKSRSVISLILIGGLILITTLAGPTWEQRPIPVFKKQSSLVIILDLSASMDSTDVKPSRLKRAQHKVLDILKARQEGQTALVVFAGEAFSVTPLTEDTETIASQVKSLNTSIMPIQGSNSDSALKLALKLLTQASQVSGDILLVTDGINTESLRRAKEISAKGYRISVLAVGTKQGAPIPLVDGGFLTDSSGAMVMPSVNFSLLNQIASIGHGQIQRLSADDKDINRLLAHTKSLDHADKSDKTELNTDTWYEMGPYLLILLIPLAAYGFRKGIVAVLVVFLIPVAPHPAQAIEWSSLWKNDNQQAIEHLQNNNAKTAAEQFNDPVWKAAALYKNGQYQKALEIYNQLDELDTETLYNKANTLAKLGNLGEAIKTYDEVLKQGPNEDAEYNRKLLKQLQEQQKNSDQSQDSSQQSDKKEKSDQSEQAKSSQEQQESSKSENSDQTGQQDQQQSPESEEEQKNSQQQESSEQSDKENKSATQEPADEKEQQNENQAEESEEKTNSQQAARKNNKELTKEQMEQLQANEQWLRRIPDDPGGLLKRKFHYQARQKPQSKSDGRAQW